MELYTPESMHRFHQRVAPRSVQLLDFAVRVAHDAHEGQFRKYTDDPYVVHPLRVGRTVGEVFPDVNMIMAGYLHDTVEDTDMTVQQISDMGFGPDVAQLVNELTDVSKPEDGNRDVRKGMDRAHTAQASPQAKTVKLADLLDNTCSIVTEDPKFARTYMREKALLLNVLEEGNPVLFARAAELLVAYKEAYPDWSVFK